MTWGKRRFYRVAGMIAGDAKTENLFLFFGHEPGRNVASVFFCGRSDCTSLLLERAPRKFVCCPKTKRDIPTERFSFEER